MPGTRDRRPRPARESGRPKRPPRPADSLPLDERAIREHVDERSFRRGQDYARRGAISDARRQGNRLTGRCAGTSAPSYRVEATITGGRIAAADCECPVGEGGRCKHVAALLLTWRDDPARFREVRSLGDVLAGLSKEDLIALVGRMVEQRPELEALVEPSPADGDRTDVDSGPYREKAAAALLGDDWEVVPAVALSAVRSAGDRLLNRGEARRAAAAYRGLVEGAVDAREVIREAFDDEALAVVAAGAASLARCLERLAEDDPVRASAIDALFELLRLDVELGGFGLADEAVKLAARHMTPDERADVAERLDELSDEAEDEWAVRSLDELSLELEANRLDDETFLKRCRKQGLTRPLFDRLATLGRWDEAIAALGKVSDHELPEYADLLVERGRPEAAERLMRTRFARRRGGEDWWLGQWLERFYVSRKAWPEATEIARDRFVRQPDRAGWLTLRDYATRSGTWETVRAEAARAADRRASPADRIRIHLDEGEIDAALRRLEAMKGKRAIGTDSHDLRRDVARAAEESRPEASLALYWAEVELLILGRSREGYRAACEHLRRLRGLYDRLGRSDEWRPAIEAIRQENPRLRALHDELRRAGL